MPRTAIRFANIACWVVPAAVLCGCASGHALAGTSLTAEPRSQPPMVLAGSGADGLWGYRCDGGAGFSVRFGNGDAVVTNLTGGSQVLLRDAGGATPRQTVYSNEHLRVEFGLGESGREAILRDAGAAEAAHCVAQ